MNNLAQPLNNLAQPFRFANQPLEQPLNLLARAHVRDEFLSSRFAFWICKPKKKPQRLFEVVQDYELEKKKIRTTSKKVVQGCSGLFK